MWSSADGCRASSAPMPSLCYTGARSDAVSTDVSASAALVAGMVPASGGWERGLGNAGLYLGEKPFAQLRFQFPGDAALSRKKVFLRETAHV